MKPILLRGANVWDGSGAPTFPGDVLVEGFDAPDDDSVDEELLSAFAGASAFADFSDFSPFCVLSDFSDVSALSDCALSAFAASVCSFFA